ncbi:MAG: hypothetical protein ACTHN0_19390 [Aquihabitans sp.]
MCKARMQSKAVLGLLAASLLAVGAAAPASAAPPYGTDAIVYTVEGQQYPYYESSFDAPGATPIVGDFVGADTQTGHLEDILWYTPGAGGDQLWRTKGDRTFAPSAISISGNYQPLVGYFAGDDWADIFWYAPGTGQDVLWDFNGDGSITKTNYTVNGTYKPIVGTFTEDGGQDIIWYAPGTAKDAWWDFGPDGKVEKPINVNGTFTPVVGSFAGSASPTFDYVQDIIWYAPGTAADSLWNFKGANGAITTTPLTINGTFTPIPGDFTHDGFNDVIWYAPGSAADFLWNFTNATGGKTSTPLTINGTYTPIAGNLYDQINHQTDVLWFGAGAKPDAIWDFDDGADYTTRPISVNGSKKPVLAILQVVTYEGSPRFGADVISRGEVLSS